MDTCIFCKIAQGDASCYKIYENDTVLAFLDISGDVDGHTLVVPKRHFKSLLDIDEQAYLEVMKAVKVISQYYVDTCGYEGINLLHASEEAAGQSVPHFHIHIIPRKQNDGIEAWPDLTGGTQHFEVMQKLLKIK